MSKNTIKKSKIDYIVFGIIATGMLIHCILLLIPLFWAITQSFNDYYNYMLNSFSFPEKLFDFSNYETAFQKINMTITRQGKKFRMDIFNMTFYSLVIAIGLAFMQTTSACLLGYAVGKYGHWRESKIISNVNLFVMTLSIIGSLPSSLQLHRALGTYNNLIPFLLVGHYGAGMGVLLFAGAFRGCPEAYREAAMMDGAGHYTIMFKIYFPMIMPLYAARIILNFIGQWNNYMTVLTYLPSYPNLTYGVYMFQLLATNLGYSVPEILAGFIICALPTSVLWICSQKMITSKLMVGGLKG